MAPNCRTEGLEKVGCPNHIKWARESSAASLHLPSAASGLKQPRHQQCGKATMFRIVSCRDNKCIALPSTVQATRTDPVDSGKRDHAMRIA